MKCVCFSIDVLHRMGRMKLKLTTAVPHIIYAVRVFFTVNSTLDRTIKPTANDLLLL